MSREVDPSGRKQKTCAHQYLITVKSEENQWVHWGLSQFKTNGDNNSEPPTKIISLIPKPCPSQATEEEGISLQQMETPVPAGKQGGINVPTTG